MIVRSKKGMTLTEVLVALLVLLVLLPTISVCIFSVMTQYRWTKSYADMCGVVSVIDGTVERELAISDGFEAPESGTVISYNKSGSQKRTIATLPSESNAEQTILCIDDIPAFDAAFYKDISVTALFAVIHDGSAVRVTLTYTGVSQFVSTFIVEQIASS